MPKNKKATRRVPRSGVSRTYGNGNGKAVEPAAPEQPAAPVAAPRTDIRRGTFGERRAILGRPAETRSQAPLAQEYHYVPADLKRLAILSAGTFGVMIVLGLIFR